VHLDLLKPKLKSKAHLTLGYKSSLTTTRSFQHYYFLIINQSKQIHLTEALMDEEYGFTSYRWWQHSLWFFYQGDLWYMYRGHYVPFYLTHALVLDMVTLIPHGAFHNCFFLEDVYVSDSVMEIGHHAFYNCTSMTTIRMPTLLTSIDNAVFLGCSRLENFVLPHSLTKIYPHAFASCRALSRLHIPPRVTQIGHHAFQGCSRLTSVKLPTSLALLGHQAFCDCNALEDVELPICIPVIGSHVFLGNSALGSITLLECNSNNNKNYKRSFLMLHSHFGSSQGLKTIRLPNISTVLLSPGLLRQLDQHNFFSHIGISSIGRKTAIFSFLQQNMSDLIVAAKNENIS
jgi:hypothetical protein